MPPIQPARRLGERYLNPISTSVGGLSLMFKVLPRFLFERSLERTPRLPLGPFQTDPTLYQTPPDSGLRVTWFGHSASLVELDGARILIDPIWDDRAAPFQWFGPKRFFAPTLPLAQLPSIDVIVISHDHYDHLGAGTVRQLARMPAFAGTRWVTSLGVGEILSSFGVPHSQWTELNWKDCVEVNGPRGTVSVTALPARHFSGRTLSNRFHTLWSSFFLAGSRHRVFYGADSGEWEGFREIGAAYGPFDLTMLEIGAYDPLWADIHMGPDGAARTFRDLGGQGLLMPIHWGLFDLALHAWDEPIERIATLGAESPGLPLWCPNPGEPTEVVAPLLTQWWQRAAPPPPIR